MRRGRRLSALRARGAADELCRPRSVREHDRAATAPRGDHEDRVRPRAQAAGRSGVALPPQDRTSAKRRPSAKPINPPQRSRSPGPRRSDCIAPGRAWSTVGSAARSSPSRRPASSPGSCGRSPKSSNDRADITPIPSAGSVAARQRAGNPRLTYEQPAPPGPATLDPRQRLPPTNHGPAAHPNPRISV
jgi:hypothetical protein